MVIYLTQENKKTVKATIGGKEYTGIQDITQAVKTKNTGTTPVDIRIIGAVKAENNDLSCAYHKSSYALGVKEASFVTIEGVGHDATLIGAGVAAFKSEYIEIANLGLIKWGGGKDGDGISLKEDSYTWVHNNDVFYGDAGSDTDQAKGDGSMDLKDDSNHVTVSYNHFWDSGKMSLCGMKSESGPNYITYHHNWFDHSDSRHPRIRTMTVHVTGASCFVEGNFFRNAHDPMMSSKQGTDATGSGTFSGEKGGVIKAYNNKFEQNNTNGVKFQFITNKYDYTNNRALGEYKEWYEDVGTPNADGTYTIYDSKVTNSSDEIAENSLIAVEDASKKGAYYQTSKGKTAFYIDVPATVTKVIVKAKCGSSGKTGSADMLSVNGTKVSMDMAADYKEYEVAVSVKEDSVIEIANVNGSNSMNINEIKVIATAPWHTKLTSGADLSDIDAYEVDTRSETVPDTVKTRSGGTTYSNFDTEMGNSGLGLSADPTNPDVAKAAVLKYSGRHAADYAWTFTNATDDASYALNAELNTELVNYKTSMTKIQGETAASTGGESGGDSGDTPGTGDDSGDTPTTPEAPAEGVIGSLTYPGPKNTGISFTVSGNTMDFYPSTGKVSVLKMENSTTVTFTTPGSTADTYTATIAYFNVNTESELTFTADDSSTVVVAISGNAGKQGSKSDLTGTTVNATATLKGGTAYTMKKSSSKQFGVVSITITK